MKIFLSSESTLRDINREFQNQFPFLKLAFYRQGHQPEQTSLFGNKLSSKTTLKNISMLLPGYISIDPMDSVAEVEQRFQNKFGLPVQIFRRTGDVWVETVQTDNLTLLKQNSLGTLAPKMNFNIHTLFL